MDAALVDPAVVLALVVEVELVVEAEDVVEEPAPPAPPVPGSLGWSSEHAGRRRDKTSVQTTGERRRVG